MKNGFIKVATASIHTSIANCQKNTDQIIEMIKQADLNQAKIITFPELCITGYTCEIYFFKNVY